MDLFRVRLNCIDHYQATPSSFDPPLKNNPRSPQISNESKFPVIRVFGATETGQKVCAHIHGAFPYLYVEYTGNLIPDDVSAFIHRFHVSIDRALAASYRRNIDDRNCEFVARITLVKGIPFYGYHVGHMYYLKIYMLNPMVMTRLADVLRQGAVMKRVFQPYEAHLQYLLQWMVDYNLYGCGYINCKKFKFRSPVPRYHDLDRTSHLWHDRSIAAELLTDEDTLQRASHCSIEVDICVQDIMNRHDIKPRPLHHDFIERLNPLAPDEKLVHSMASLWRDETQRRKSRFSTSDPGSSPFPPEAIVSMSADPRNSHPSDWIHEEEYRKSIALLISEEKSKSDGTRLSFGSFVKRVPFESTIKTTLEAVEDLYPENLRPALGLPSSGLANCNTRIARNEDVDERQIENLVANDNTENMYESDEDIIQELEIFQQSAKDTNHKYTSLVSKDLESSRGVMRGGSKNYYKSNFYDAADAKSAVDFSVSTRDVTKVIDKRGSSSDAMPSCSEGQENFNVCLGKQHNELKGLKRSESSVSVLTLPRKRQRIIYQDESSICRTPSVETPMKLCSSGPSDHSAIGTVPSVVYHSEVGNTPKSKKKLESNTSTASKSTLAVSTSRRNRLSQPTGKGQEISFHFNVTKDPHNPSTTLRLSHRSNSHPGSTEKKRQITSDPNLLLQKSTALPPAPNSFVSTGNSMSSGPPPSLMVSMKQQSKKCHSRRFLVFRDSAPTTSAVVSSMQDFNIPPFLYQDAFYSDELDAPERPREWAGREFRLESLSVPFLPYFDHIGTSNAKSNKGACFVADRIMEESIYSESRRRCGLRSWTVIEPPPTYAEVSDWSRQQMKSIAKGKPQKFNPISTTTTLRLKRTILEIEGPTQKNKHGFKSSQDHKTTSLKHEAQYMSTMSLEVHVNTRGDLVPDPEEDEVQCLFWCLQSDEEGFESNCTAKNLRLGIVVVSEDGVQARKIARQVPVEVQQESSELDLMIRMVEIVRNHDPDILTGYEVHGGSWGYLVERARLKYDYDLCDEFSRMKSGSHGKFANDSDKWDSNNTSTIRITGRHMINIWRAMLGELNLLQYTMENVCFHLLQRRIPHFTWADITKWYTEKRPAGLVKVLNHYISKVQLDLEILERNGLIERASEQARLLGVDFFSVLSRGSQFKVESLMFRIAKPENFLLISPSRKQVGGQNALECLPLVMEPLSAFYNSPLLVLDFQSLYPSIMIAYNYCYSTFLGRIANWRGTNKMGFTEYKRQQRLLELLKDHINISPNGIMYAKPEIRKSLLAKMLVDILETRLMVKSGMKMDKDDQALQRLLNNRQLALKLIANVTYGYTSASFSGRMPCSEIADSIVQTGRETLERAIALIHSVKRWGAEVVYGDTDSIFVYLKGRTKDQAFDIGEEIAKTITNMNPRPIKLKFEKVYLPCILLAKKRYVGFKYESRSQVEPEFDAKGIETIRRDGTPAEQKIEEKALKIFFRTSDLSQVKSYFQSQCEKIMQGSVSIQDFCFAKEVKLGTYSDKGPLPAGALIGSKRMIADARAGPRKGERVPYVVISGAPGARLIDRCVAPETLLASTHHALDAEYYISKHLIPPLARIFDLVGANVRSWYEAMPKVQRIRDGSGTGKTLESYMTASACVVCGEKRGGSQGSLCVDCAADRPRTVLALRERLGTVERSLMDLQRVCRSCAGLSPVDEVCCVSKDCPVFYTRTRHETRLKFERGRLEPIIEDFSRLCIDRNNLDW